jgi:hypothetical protein
MMTDDNAPSFPTWIQCKMNVSEPVDKAVTYVTPNREVLGLNPD